MAKWGEGDPRWIVEERADATNVHNWHWTERDASAASKENIKQLLVGLKVQDDKGECEITELSSISGEASASSRKGKLIFFYEWDIKLEWSGHLTDCTTKLKGGILIPNLSDENEISEIDISITTKTNTAESRRLQAIMMSDGKKLIRQRISKYIEFLKEEFTKGMILPSTDEPPKETKPTSINNSVSPPANVKGSSPSVQHQNQLNEGNVKRMQLGARLETRKLHVTQEFKCSVEDLYQTLTDPQRVSAFSRSQAVMDVEIGGKFALFDGKITGSFISLDPKKIVQRWRSSNWPEDHYSTVTFDLVQQSDCTRLTLTQVGIPSDNYEDISQGWNTYYWQGIITTFGYGTLLY